MKPLIGITPLFDEDKGSPWMQTAYMNGILKAGGLPVMLPVQIEKDDIRLFVEKLDGFLFTGGPDISPYLYGETPQASCGPCVEVRDAMEKKLFEELLPSGKPILGICRGCQLLNALSGGTLYQDIATQYETQLTHRLEPPQNSPCHKVTVIKGTLLHQILRKNTLIVNSIHHQAIRTPALGLQVAAYAEDGLIEAAFRPDHPFFLTVQWHPERMFETDPLQLILFESFIQACNINSCH